MKPTPIERALRMKVISRVEYAVQQVWPNAKVEVFGSFVSGLALPKSDIDLMIIGASGESYLHLLAAEISASGIAEPNSLQVKEDLRIPIIEFIDRESHINIDTSFHNEPTLQVAPLINGFQRKYPVLLKLVFVLKQYLKQHDLNDVFTGIHQSDYSNKMVTFFLQFFLFRWNFIVCFNVNVHQFLAKTSHLQTQRRCEFGQFTAGFFRIVWPKI